MMIPELQPVILAAGEGSKMYPLTEEIPKCLLPVGNYPMIWYVISYLERYGFNDFLIIVRQSARQSVSTALNALFSQKGSSQKLKFDICSINDDDFENDNAGTATSLITIKDKIKTDVLLVSCDMLTDAPLHRLVDLHRTHNSSVTSLLLPRQDVTEPEPMPQKGSKSKVKDPYTGQKDFVSVDPKENRLLMLTNESELDGETICIKKSLLKRYPNLEIRTDLIDSHLYILKKWVIDYIAKLGSFESFKGDVIPHIIQKQFTKPSKIKDSSDLMDDVDSEFQQLNNEKDSKDIFKFLTEDPLSEMTSEWSSYGRDPSDNAIKCHAYVADKSYCVRVNNLPAFTHLNRQITKLYSVLTANTDQTMTHEMKVHSSVVLNGKSQIGADSLVGESSSINEHVTLKRSVIGKHCTIGTKCKITNSVIMNHVIVEDGCTIQNSVICDNAHIEACCKLVNCQVAKGHTLATNSELKDQAMVQEDFSEGESDEDY